MRVGIVIIGDEILNGQVVDTNSGEIARQISPIGGQLNKIVVVGDNESQIKHAICALVEDVDIDVVVTTGGLGPTKDDITKKVFCDLTNGRLVLNDEMLQNVRDILTSRGVEINHLSELQAMVPNTCLAIRNICGTAPIMWFEMNGKPVIAMPGVPFETKMMLETSIVAKLRNRFAPNKWFSRRSLLLRGISESAVAEKISSWEDNLPKGYHLAYLPNLGYLRLRLDGESENEELLEQTIGKLHHEMVEMLHENIFHDKDQTPQEILKQLLVENHLTFASAESCTGGNVAAAMTSLPGSSECTLGGVVAYDNAIKENVLGVNRSTLERHGAVSEETALEMVQGLANLFGASICVSTSGIAGPGGAVPGKPVGTVCSAIAFDGKVHSFTDHFRGSRSVIVERSVNTVLIRAIEIIRKFRQLP